MVSVDIGVTSELKTGGAGAESNHGRLQGCARDGGVIAGPCERGEAVALSPQDIEHRTFLTTLRGYDKDEVAAFLRRVAADYRDATEGSGRGRPGGANDPPRPSVGERVAAILEAAHATAAGIVAAARRTAADADDRARRVVAHAEERAAAIVTAARADAARAEPVAALGGRLEEARFVLLGRIRAAEAAVSEAKAAIGAVRSSDPHGDRVGSS